MAPTTTTVGANFITSPMIWLRLRFAFDNPGLHPVVVVCEIILGDVVGGGVPDAVVAKNVPQCLIEVLGGIATTDIVGMQRQTHHAPVFRTFAVERVELVLD